LARIASVAFQSLSHPRLGRNADTDQRGTGLCDAAACGKRDRDLRSSRMHRNDGSKRFSAPLSIGKLNAVRVAFKASLKPCRLSINAPIAR
jgi:hypothetical protein